MSLYFLQPRYLFWSEIGSTSLISRSSLSGKAKKIISHSMSVRPIGMAADHMQHRLYWVDGIKNTIESMSYDGSDRQRFFLIRNGFLTSIYLYKVCLNGVRWHSSGERGILTYIWKVLIRIYSIISHKRKWHLCIYMPMFRSCFMLPHINMMSNIKRCSNLICVFIVTIYLNVDKI